MFLTYGVLTLAIVSLWFTGDDRAPSWRRNLWLMILAVSLASALVCRIVQPVGVIWIAGLVAATRGFARGRNLPWLLMVEALTIIALAGGLMAHVLPGFDNPRVIFAVKFTRDSIPYTLYLNYDKTIAGILILGGCHARMTRAAEWRAMLQTAAPWAGGVLLTILMLSCACGYVRFEPKFPEETKLWLWVNLCFTCVAEEALFRGFIQGQLQRAWKGIAGGRWLALGLAAVLFGVAHAAGGTTYVALATVAGLGYGWVYQRTGRIEASILTHFALNTVHFFFFTYPALHT